MGNNPNILSSLYRMLIQSPILCAHILVTDLSNSNFKARASLFR